MDMQRHECFDFHSFVHSVHPPSPSSILTYKHRINNSDPKILTGPIAVIAIQNNYDCSITITQDQANQPVGTGWTVLLANPLNNTDVRIETRLLIDPPLLVRSFCYSKGANLFDLVDSPLFILMRSSCRDVTLDVSFSLTYPVWAIKRFPAPSHIPSYFNV